MENGTKPAGSAATEQALEALEQLAADASTTPMLNEITISSGVKFSIKRVAAEMIRRLAQQRPAPKPPVWLNEDKGREEENPNDPNYLEIVNTYNLEIGEQVMHLFLMFGTEPLKVPKELDKPADTDWSDGLSYLGLEVPATGKVRYLRWLLDYILTDPEDAQNLFVAVLHKSGILQEDLVQQAVQSFRGGDQRGVDNDGSTPEPSGHGDTVQPVAARADIGD